MFLKLFAVCVIVIASFSQNANGRPSESEVSQSPASQSPASQSPAAQTPASQSPAAQTPAAAFRPALADLPKRGMWSGRPAKRWQDALVTGNGTLGAMVMGNPTNERIVLNHERLYEPLVDQPCPVPDISAALPEIRRLMQASKYKEAYEFSYQAAVDAGFPGIQWTDPYHPACTLEIRQEAAAEPIRYWRSTDFNSGEVAVHWSVGAQNFRRQTFVSRSDSIVVQRISSEGGSKVRGQLRLVNQDKRPSTERTNRFGGGYQDPLIDFENGWLTYQCKYLRSKRGYLVMARVVADQGMTKVDDDGLHFDANAITILIAIESLEDFSEAPEVLKQMRAKLESVKPNYQPLLDRHALIHGDLMGRVTFQIDGDHDRNLSSEALIALQKKTASETLQPAMIETMFDMGRYTLISSSGQWPPNLMGIWNGDWRPDWSGDFTLDANVNLQIAAANLGNLPEAAESYSHLIEGLIPDWQTNARNLFGCRGVVSGCRTAGRNNLQTHFSSGFPGHFWTAGAQWLVLPMWEHYQTTGDPEYLQQKLLPIMKQIATFYVDFLLVKDSDGKRMFVPSYSPENKPDSTKCPATINATMDIACAKEALANLISVCQSEGISDPELAIWKTLIDELPPYLQNPDGSLKEWARADLTDNNQHRHVSHLYPVWPGHEINPEDTPELFAAAALAAKKRGRGNGSAHGLAHMALIGARLKDAEVVYGNLKFMVSNDYLLTSLFTFHNPGRIYNADMLHSLPAVVMEMLVYSKPGEIELLPALSSKLPRGKIRGVCCRNQTVVEVLEWDLDAGQVKLTLCSRIDQSLTLRIRSSLNSISDAKGNSIPVHEDGTAVVQLLAQQPLSLKIRFSSTK